LFYAAQNLSWWIFPEKAPPHRVSLVRRDFFLHHLLLLMVICFMPHGDLLLSLFGKRFSVAVIDPRGAVYHFIAGTSLQS